jgi:Pyruvate/2-oxoacid:ferredoxin oxidoreductase delta subunit
MKTIYNIGIGITLVAFTIFIASLFLNDYKLTTKLIDDAGLGDVKTEALKEASSGFVGKTISSKPDFVNKMKNALAGANAAIIDQYKISDKDIDALVKLSSNSGEIKYSTDFAENVFPESNEAEQYKAKGIKDFTGWIADKDYQSADDFRNDLKNSLNSFNNNILYTKAFDDYAMGKLLFVFTKNAGTGLVANNTGLFFFLTFILAFIGAMIFILPKFWDGLPGIKHNRIFKTSLNSQGVIGILMGSFLILFYVVLYFFPVYIVEWVSISEVASMGLFGREASQWFLYGFLYTFAVLVMGLRFLTKYRHNKYQRVRTYSVMFFQLVVAFMMPQILFALNLPEVDLKNIWPLDYSFFYEWRIQSYIDSGTMGMMMLVWSIALIVIAVPVLTYFIGKRWYCSWVCGCGGLAETAGDPFRQLSSKKIIAWKIERYLIYTVLVFAVVMTSWVLYTFFTGKSVLLGIDSYQMRKIYGFLISSIFSGVVGTGFYPLMGNRVWCRFGCPLAAYMGIIQRFKSRFRITTNGGQCISCGNCSTYCEMGIDVRWYAQRGQNIARASCVGCGVCAAVCPRGVLKLENNPVGTGEKGRLNGPSLLGNDGVIKVREIRLGKESA